MASHTHDDGFHEIQLNGKQLVFLFMAATVVSVVIFLCGVLVGRGVRAERSMVAQAAALNEAPAPDPVAAPAPVAATVQPGSDPTVAAPPEPVDDDLSYFDRLEKRNSGTADDLRPDKSKGPPAPSARGAKAEIPSAPKADVARTSRPEPARETKTVPAKAPKAEPPTEARPETTGKPAPPPAQLQAAAPAPIAEPIDAAPAAAAANGFAVQVAAVNARSDADAIVKRLASKGYAAYVEVPASGTASVYRVRVGTFKTRREADVIAARLQKEEQIKPWVTR